MVMSWIYCAMVFLSILFALITGRGAQLASAVPQGAQMGITLAVSIAGSICLWTGVGNLMEKVGITQMLGRLLRPVLGALFPSSQTDTLLASDLTANICANILGLGNAATPMGIRAVRRMAQKTNHDVASDDMCRLIVLNTASIQLIPTTVAAIRASLGCSAPFDILPAVWITSFCSAGAGLLAAFLLGKLSKHD